MISFLRRLFGMLRSEKDRSWSIRATSPARGPARDGAAVFGGFLREGLDAVVRRHIVHRGISNLLSSARLVSALGTPASVVAG